MLTVTAFCWKDNRWIFFFLLISAFLYFTIFPQGKNVKKMGIGFCRGTFLMLPV